MAQPSSASLELKGRTWAEISALPLHERISLVRKNSARFAEPAQFEACTALFVAVTSTRDINAKLRERLWPGCIKAALAYHSGAGVTQAQFEAFVRAMLQVEGFWSPAQLSALQAWGRGDFSSIAHQLAHSQRAPLEHWTLRRLRVAERVLLSRTERFVLVLALQGAAERHDALAVLRTMECMGVQHVWLVAEEEAVDEAMLLAYSRRITRGNEVFLSVRVFASVADALAALAAEQRTLWLVDACAGGAGRESANLATLASSAVPERLAVVLGAETRALSEAWDAAAAARVHVALAGFGATLPVSVHAALLIQRLFALCPEARGDLSEAALQKLRAEWYARLARKSKSRQEEYAQYLANPPPPIEDLRRAEGEGHDEPHWMPKKVKRRIANKEAARLEAATAAAGNADSLLRVEGLDEDADSMDVDDEGL